MKGPVILIFEDALFEGVRESVQPATSHSNGKKRLRLGEIESAACSLMMRLRPRATTGLVKLVEFGCQFLLIVKNKKRLKAFETELTLHTEQLMGESTSESTGESTSEIALSVKKLLAREGIVFRAILTVEELAAQSFFSKKPLLRSSIQATRFNDPIRFEADILLPETTFLTVFGEESVHWHLHTHNTNNNKNNNNNNNNNANNHTNNNANSNANNNANNNVNSTITANHLDSNSTSIGLGMLEIVQPIEPDIAKTVNDDNDDNNNNNGHWKATSRYILSEKAVTVDTGIDKNNRNVNNSDVNNSNVKDRIQPAEIMKSSEKDEHLRHGLYETAYIEKWQAVSCHNWEQLAQNIMTRSRIVTVRRTTKETDIALALNLDGTGKSNIRTGLHFFNHMLENFAKHAQFDLNVAVEGDLHVDEHHTIEDTAIVLGTALKKALGGKQGITRYAFSLPMDESSATCLLDLSGRAYTVWQDQLKRERVGDFPIELVRHFFETLATAGAFNLHLTLAGANDHHQIESGFKALAKCFREASHRIGTVVPSTKGGL
ncbi:hypothetical protein COTS27_00729 [Spirochaetota bacterium]|nr:hypothetical protein COTS27_00729 [Spirochaetota bacterium]